MRADQARSAEDANRERDLVHEVSLQRDTIQQLERQIRDTAVKLPDFAGSYADGCELSEITARFQATDKQVVLKKLNLTWDEIFSAIGPSMFGYIVRRARINNDNIEVYPFEHNLKELVRTKIFDEVGQRSINLFPHEVDAVLIQYKQLGYIEMAENNEGESKFRGFTLTVLGEHKLAKLSSRIV